MRKDVRYQDITDEEGEEGGRRKGGCVGNMVRCEIRI